MAVTVVNGFEAVHIKEHDAERPLGAARAIEFGFDDRDEAAVVGKSGEGIACRQRTNLVEEPGLIDERATQNDGVAGDFAELSKEKWAVKKLPGKERGHVAGGVEQGDQEQRIIIERSFAVVLFSCLVSAIEEN